MLLDKGVVKEAPITPSFFSHSGSQIHRGPPASHRSAIAHNLCKTIWFHMEIAKTVLAASCKDDWRVSVDLKDDYFQVPVHQESHKYLCFIWKNHPCQFEFSVLISSPRRKGRLIPAASLRDGSTLLNCNSPGSLLQTQGCQ